MTTVLARAPLSFLLAAVYFVGAVASGLVPWAVEPHNPFSTILGVLFTLPWSILSVLITDRININLTGSIPVVIGTIVIGALLNAAIIYAGASFIERSVRQGR